MFAARVSRRASLSRDCAKGIGLTGANITMSAFGPIHVSPFGTEGDLMLVPDPSTEVQVSFGDGAPEYFYLGDIRTTEGESWDFCPRHFLRRALQALRAEAGLTVRAAFRAGVHVHRHRGSP